MKLLVPLVAFLCLAGCSQEAPNPETAATTPQPAAPSEAAAPPKATKVQAPRPDIGGTVVGVAAASKEHSTLVAALTAADLVVSLGSPGGAYTVFAPTNDAFAKLPEGTVENLLEPENKAELQRVLKHHAAVPVLQLKDLRDGQSLAMADGSKVTFQVKDGKTMVDGATVLASLPASNGVIHVVDTVIVPAPKE